MLKHRTLIAMSITGMLAMTGCATVAAPPENGSTSQDAVSEEPVAPSEAEESSAPEVSDSDTPAGIGQTITLSAVDVTVNSVESTLVDALSSSPDEEIYLLLDVTVANNSEDDVGLSSLISFSLRGSDSYEYRVAIFVDTKGSLDTTVVPGDQVRGQIAFDVPELDYYDLTVNPSLFGDRGVIRINAGDIE